MNKKHMSWEKYEEKMINIMLEHQAKDFLGYKQYIKDKTISEILAMIEQAIKDEPNFEVSTGLSYALVIISKLKTKKEGNND